tara:strand:- start:184 stop:447 length:264 start_codon:yes stop_codon:yes gene_type:complete
MLNVIDRMIVGIFFLWLLKWIVGFILTMYGSSSGDINYKIEEDKEIYLKEQERLDARRSIALNLAMIINPIFIFLSIVWIVVCIVRY